MHERRVFWTAMVTALMWIVIALISIVFMRLEGVTAAGAAIFVIVMAGIAIGGTAMMWSTLAGVPAAANLPAAEVSRRTTKTKRLDPERLARLMETLDEDQIIELETLLLAQREDGLDDPGR